MSARHSPSWPSLGQVQKLTSLFEEKCLPQQGPKILKNPEPMPKLKPELIVRFKEVEEPAKEPLPRKAPKPKPLPKPTADVFYEVQTPEEASGDGGDTIARLESPRKFPDFEHSLP